MMKSDQRKVLETYISRAPELSGWLADPKVVSLLDAFDRADVRTARRQRRYFHAARFAAICTTIATGIAALVLIGVPPTQWLGILQFACVAASLAAVFRISHRRLVDRWLTARATVEAGRAELFRNLVRADFPATGAAGGRGGLATAFDAFRECHLDYQHGFYTRRSEQLSRSAGSVTPLKYAGYVFLALSVLAGARDTFIYFADKGGFAYTDFADLLRWMSLPSFEPHRWQLGLGALASASLSCAAAWTLINQDDRNAARYWMTARRLDELKKQRLTETVAAADAGNRAGVLSFTDSVQSILDAEHSAWVASRPPDDPNAGPAPPMRRAL